MIWVAWRQQRTESIVLASVLVLLAVLLVPTGLEMASAYHSDGLSACIGATAPPACGNAIQSFTSRFAIFDGLMGWLTLVPGLVGVLLAAPFVLQIESGGYRLDWTQSITRRRWIAGKLGLAVAAALLFALVFVELVTWWRTPYEHLYGRMQTTVFDSEGVVVFGYTLFALGLALALGVLWRRAVASLVVAFIGYFVARIFVDTWLRQRLTTPAQRTWRPSAGGGITLNRDWVISEYPTDRAGHRIPVHIVSSCIGVPGGKACRAIRVGGGWVHDVYEPASRFWHMQAVELVLYAGVALLLIAFAAWWTNARAA